MKTYPIKRALSTILILGAAFLAGRFTAQFVAQKRSVSVAARQVVEGTNSVSEAARQAAEGTSAVSEAARQAAEGTSVVSEAARQVMEETENWGLGFGEEGSRPTGNVSVAELKKYNAYYMSGSEDKKLYLTFDCGYENGNTESILDALKKHQVKATFFVVGHFLETAPELVERMVAEGHTVGNHTYHHPDMSKISDMAAFQKEMDEVRAKYKEVTNQEMPMYYRPPQGKYSIENLKMAKELGYSTFFWSLAYVDWKTDAQPAREEAISKLTKRVHPGAIVLLHNTSATNAEILDELLGRWEEMGYGFGTLEELTEEG